MAYEMVGSGLYEGVVVQNIRQPKKYWTKRVILMHCVDYYEEVKRKSRLGEKTLLF